MTLGSIMELLSKKLLIKFDIGKIFEWNLELI
jgi:hypothetical protein